MKTQLQFEVMRKAHQTRLKSIRRVLNDTRVSSDKRRAAHISGARVYHQARTVAREFNKVARTVHKGHWPSPKSIKSAIEDKYTATALAILELLHAQKIPIDRWMLSQVETLRKSKFVTLFHCYGLNALERYKDWEARQKRMYKHSKDRKQQTSTLERELWRAISRAHKSALTWVTTFGEIKPPNLAAALFYMFPHISGWYCLAYKEFRELVMETGLCTEPYLVLKWKAYKRSEHIQNICEEALMSVIQKHGAVSWS